MSFGLGALGALGGSAGGSVLGPAAATMGAFQGLVNAGISYKNYQLQRDQYDYSRSLQNQIFAREDNSIQRRVADLKAAGLSPVLAAGQGAGTGGVVSTAAPQMGQMSDLATNALALISQEQDISKTGAEQKYLEMQADKSAAEKRAIEIKAAMDAHDLALARQSGVRTHPSGIGATVTDVLGAVKNSLLSPVVDKQIKKVSDVDRAKKGYIPNASRSAAGQKLWYEE